MAEKRPWYASMANMSETARQRLAWVWIAASAALGVITVVLPIQAGNSNLLILGRRARPTVTVTKSVPAPGATVTRNARPRPTATVTKLVLVAPVQASSPPARTSKAFNWTGLSAFIAAIGTLLAGIGAVGISLRRARSAQPEKPDHDAASATDL
jgi:hypothetical protein